MTRLFLRFYFGVITILILASIVQSYAMWFRASEPNAEVFQQVTFGGYRLARDQMEQATPENYDSTLSSIQNAYDFPVEIRAFGDVATTAWPQPLVAGEPSYIDRRHIGVSIHENTKVLVFGPMPAWVGPTFGVVAIGFGFVSLLAAIAIAFLLRPVVKQLRAVEKTASAIASGDLGARINDRGYTTSLPIATAFNTMADRTESMLKSQRELLQAVSHELRTPLARIRFATELVETSQSDEQRLVRLQSIDRATEELDGLVGELLSYVRLDSDSEQSEFEPVNLNELFSDAIEIHAPLFPHIQFTTGPLDNLHVEADRVGLARAIGNLVANASRHAANRVGISASEDKDQVVIQVDDDGEGIAELDRDRIFEPFVRLENNSSKGTGLGLALVKRIASRHSGDVCVAANEQGGSRFQIRLPKTRPLESKSKA